jgi:chorismate synthase
VLERASARETAARVAAGVVAKKFIAQVCATTVDCEVVQFGGIKRAECAGAEDFLSQCERLAAENKTRGDTIGGIIQVVANAVPRGLGSYATAKTRLDAALSGALMSIQAFKGVEIGDGFAFANTPGTLAHDHLVLNPRGEIVRSSNHAGGIEGGISNGMPIIMRAVVKPIPSIPGGLPTVNLENSTADWAHSQRSDVSAVFPASVVASSVVALTLADFVHAKFGGDSVAETRSNFEHHNAQVLKVVNSKANAEEK